MRKVFSRLVLFFVVGILVSLPAACTDKTATQWLSETDVCFEAQKTHDGISVIGKEHGKELFKTNVNIFGSKFNGFTNYSSGNFYLELLNDTLYFQHTFANGEVFEVSIDTLGNFLLPRPILLTPSNTGFRRSVSWGFNTYGTFTNEDLFMADSVVIQADRIINKHSFQTRTCQLFQNQFINDGVFIVGKAPVARVNLKTQFENYAGADVPKFVYGQVLNRGTWLSTGNFDFKGGLQFDNGGFSSFENVRVLNNGGLKARKPIIVSRKLSGQISSIETEEGGCVQADEIDVGTLEHLKVAKGSYIYSPKDWSLKVTGKYENHGEISSRKNLKLEVVKPLTSQQTGFIVAGETLDLDSGKLKGDEEFERYIADHPDKTVENDPICRRLWEALMLQNGFTRGTKIFGLGGLIGKKCIKIRIVDHYLNRIHEHYHNGVLVIRTETGYIYQGTTTTERVERDLPQGQQILSNFLNITIPARTKFVSNKINFVSKDLATTIAEQGQSTGYAEGSRSKLFGSIISVGAKGQEIFRLAHGDSFLAAFDVICYWHFLNQSELSRCLAIPLYKDLYDFAMALQDPALHDPGSWWTKRFCQKPLDRSTTTIGNPFKIFTDIHPLMMAMPIAILCDDVKDETTDILGKYITQILGKDAPTLDYMLEFMSSGLDPPLDQIDSPEKGMKPRLMALFAKDLLAKTELSKQRAKTSSEELDQKGPEDPKTHDHHIFPVAMKEYFERVGININNFTVTITETRHLKVLHGFRGGWWNGVWKLYKWTNPNATREEIIGFARQMMKRHNFIEESLHVYRKPSIHVPLR